MLFLSSDFFLSKLSIFKKLFQEYYQLVSFQNGTWSGSKLFALPSRQSFKMKLIRLSVKGVYQDPEGLASGILTLCMLGNFTCFLLSADLSKLTFSKDSLRNILRVSNCILSVLIWIQTDCKVYSQMTKLLLAWKSSSITDYPWGW